MEPLGFLESDELFARETREVGAPGTDFTYQAQGLTENVFAHSMLVGPNLRVDAPDLERQIQKAQPVYEFLTQMVLVIVPRQFSPQRCGP
jgi:hypothetical protein